MNSTIIPVHDKFQEVDSDSTYSFLVSSYNLSNKTFQDFQAADSDSTYTSLKLSGYIIEEDDPPVLLSETSKTLDSLFIKVTKFLEERGSSTSAGFFGKFVLEDLSSAQDDLLVKVTKFFEERSKATDFQITSKIFGDVSHSRDDLVIKLIKLFEDTSSSISSVDAFMIIDKKDSANIKVSGIENTIDSSRISVDGFLNTVDSVNIINIPHSLPSVVDHSSPSNPLEPTVIVVDDASGSNTVISNVSTAPGFVPTNTFINILNTGIANRNLCNFHGTSMNLDYNGGSFTIRSRDPLGTSAALSDNLGLEFSAFGLTATTSDFGEELSSGDIQYETFGIFGNRNLHRPFNLITFKDREYLQFIGSTQLFSLPTNNTHTTLSDMARAIANTAGVTISWLVPDSPYKDTLSQNGLTGLDALGSLASQVGATLRWNGVNNYIVAYPDFFAGQFSIPDVRLIRSISYKNHLDLGLGVTGSGILGIPVNQFFDLGTKDLPNNNSTANQEIQRIGGISTKLTANSGKRIWDLPNDVIEVKYQILLGPNPQTQILPPFTSEENPDNWFFLGSPSVAGQYVKTGKFGSRQGHRLEIDSSLFPINSPDIDKGNFSMNFGIVRRNLQPLFDLEQEDVEESRRELIARIQSNNRFIKTFSANVSLDFYGSIPLPGMSIDFTYCGRRINGIIESVSITDMDVLNIEVSRYLRINYLDRKLERDLLLGNY